MATKKGHYSEEELRFIEENYKTCTDRELASALGRTEESVKRQRARRGFKKAGASGGRPSKEDIRDAVARDITSGTSYSVANLDKAQRLKLYKENFDQNNSRYRLLKNELHLAELDYYKHKYVDFMDSVGTMAYQEEDALHHMIMCDISISRIRKQIRLAEERHEQDGEPLAFGLYDMLEKLEKQFINYQKMLRTTREQRLSKEKDSKETIATHVEMYKNHVRREELGRQAGLMEIYRQQCEDDMKSSRYLLGE